MRRPAHGTADSPVRRAARRHRWLAGLIATGLLAGAMPVESALRVTERALELGPRQLTLPRGEGGMVVVRRCADCAPEILTLTTETRCLVEPGGRRLPAAAFLEMVRPLAARGRGMFVVFTAPDDARITRIVYHGGRP